MMGLDFAPMLARIPLTVQAGKPMTVQGDGAGSYCISELALSAFGGPALSLFWLHVYSLTCQHVI